LDGTPETTELFEEEFYKTSTGRQIRSQGLETKSNIKVILSLAREATGRRDISLKEFETAAKQLFLNGDLQPEEEPAAQAPGAPQLTASQRAWSEYRQFTESHSVQECKNRARVDEAYRKFLNTNLQREMGGGVGDAVEAFGTQAVRQDKSVKITQELNDFVLAYRVMSAAEIKKNSTLATNPKAAEFVRNTELAIAAGIL
jgi:hypothetical protein